MKLTKERKKDQRVKNTWKVEEVVRKRVDMFPQTKAQDPIPANIPNTEARRPSGTLSA